MPEAGEPHRSGLRSGNGIINGEQFPIIACRAAALSLGGGGPDSLLLIALSSAAGIASALAGGSKPPDVNTVPHSRGKSAIRRVLPD